MKKIYSSSNLVNFANFATGYFARVAALLLLLVGVCVYTPMWAVTIPAGTTIYVDVTNFAGDNNNSGYYLSVVGSSNSSYSINKSNTSYCASGSYSPKNDTWYDLQRVSGNIYSAKITAASSIGKISVWTKKINDHSDVWEVNVSAGNEYDGINNLFTVTSGYTKNDNRKACCFSGTWSTYVIPYTWQVHGTMINPSWTSTNLEMNDETHTATCTFKNLSAGSYTFGIKRNLNGSQNAWFNYNGSKTISATESNIALTKDKNDISLSVSKGGNYVFTLNYSDVDNPTLSVIYPEDCTTGAPSIAWATAPADGTVGGNMTASVTVPDEKSYQSTL